MQDYNTASPLRGGLTAEGSAAISSELVWIYRLLSAPPFLYRIRGSFYSATTFSEGLICILIIISNMHMHIFQKKF